MMPLGFRENSSTMAKNTREKMARYSVSLPSGSRFTAPTVKEVLAQRGMAKRGPMVRYSSVQKNTLYFRETFPASSTTPSLRLMPRATTASMGMPTAVMNTPAKALQKLLPA